MKKLVYIYLLTVCITNAFALHKWVPIPLVIISAVLALTIGKSALYPRISLRLFGKQDVILSVFLLMAFISSTVNTMRMSSINMNHLWAYFTVISLYYFSVKMIFANVNITSQDVEKYLSIAVGYTALFIIIEFLLANYRLYNVSKIIPRVSGAEYQPMFLGRFVRARGWESEPGSMILFFNLFAPIAVFNIYNSHNRILRYLYIVILMLTYAFTYSAGGIGALSISIIVVCAIYVIKHGNWKLTILISSLIIMLLSLRGSVIFKTIREYTWPLVVKITLSKSSGSTLWRLVHWNTALDLFRQHPFLGSGPGALSAMYGTGATSWHFQILGEMGIFSFMLILAFWISIFRYICLLKDKKKYVYMVSLLAGGVHYAVISTFWYPWIWLFFALVSLKYYEDVVQKRHLKIWRQVR